MSSQTSSGPTREDYTIGWLCTLPIESAAAAEMLDEEYPPLAVLPGDTNSYVLGGIGQHRVVMACMGGTGGMMAHSVATNLTKSFPNVREILMVGIGAGIPSEEYDVRLGDVVVSEAKGRFAAVVQCDFGKDETDGFQVTGGLNQPSESLVRATGAVKRNRLRNRSQIHRLVRHFDGDVLDPEGWRYQGRENDPLHELDQEPRKPKKCAECATRQEEYMPDPEVHYGVVVSGNHAIKNSGVRDRVRDEVGACCIETEAFGIMNQFPCLVIRGVCSYTDENQNHRWQQYAALTAAAYAKELSLELPLTEQAPKVSEEIHNVTRRLVDIQLELKELKSQQEETATLLRAFTRDTEFERVLQWSSPPEASSDTKPTKKNSCEGTNAWLLEG
ncbi:purine and uridine phosphorylase [Aspergillus steynii IBT 23096]|uniref:Purine and uridine phosphorylase n=1 Tax=Aspergillus steynii IBT 23096 TaxID=1392250 RepID=A0A2I2GFI8_9EURO|nr:purine and uridine phosphorylase [Aspergillus steynii IBT 23096]PLB51648.1 purine and uridine phosphorylase [Aspergillus steynii IBT 23096]